MPRDVLVNVNFPDCMPDQVADILSLSRASATRSSCASMRAMTAAVIRIIGLRLGAARMAGAAPGSDLAALTENRIAVTPLRLDLTDEPFMTKLAEVFS